MEILRETVKSLVTDVAELRDTTGKMQTDLALTRQSQNEYQQRVTEYMLRSDLGREQTNKKLDLLVQSDHEWAGARKLFAIAWAGVLGAAAIWAAWSAWVTASVAGPHGH